MRPKLRALHAEYRQLAQLDPASVSEDEIRSIQHYLIDDAVTHGIQPPTRARIRDQSWMLRVHEIERLIEQDGRLPRENTRLQRDGSQKARQSAAEWLRHQRRAATRETHSSYQRRRLETLPGFSWRPAADRWAHTFSAYTAFVQTHHRSPAYRSVDPAEKRLAGWAAKQRLAYRQGQMTGARRAALERIPIWTWGVSRRSE